MFLFPTGKDVSRNYAVTVCRSRAKADSQGVVLAVLTVLDPDPDHPVGDPDHHTEGMINLYSNLTLKHRLGIN